MFNPQSQAGRDLGEIVQRILDKEAEIATLQSAKAEIYEEAKQRGFVVKAVKAIVQMMRKDPAQRLEDAAMFNAYVEALGIDKDHIRAQGETSTASIHGREDYPSQHPDDGFAVL